MPPMEMSEWSQKAVHLMRHFQNLEEKYRVAAAREYQAAKEELTRAYALTNRESLGNLQLAIQKRAREDQTRKALIGDEQFYRGLAEMYAAIAQVELTLDEARERESYRGAEQSHDLRNVDPPCAE